MQQWEFAFVSANGRKPSFMERREDATQVRRATELIELRQRSASLHRVLSAVNSYTIRDGLLEAKQPAVLAAVPRLHVRHHSVASCSSNFFLAGR